MKRPLNRQMKYFLNKKTISYFSLGMAIKKMKHSVLIYFINIP